MAQRPSEESVGRLGDRQHGFDSRNLLDRQVAKLGERLRPESHRVVAACRRMVEVLCSSGMAGRGFAWTGFDYRGEPTPYGWPSINSQFGIVDMCGFPKDNFYYYKAWWGAEPVLHLFPHWNWEQRLGEPISVWVHSNLDSVELFLNGKSQGSQTVQPYSHLEWKVKYEAGVLEARGTKDGKIVLTAKRETTGEPASIRLTPDRIEISADGEDVCILTVEALDKDGRAIPTADALINFKVTGEGALIGVGNGDPNC